MFEAKIEFSINSQFLTAYQRYALSIEALNSFPVPVIPLQEQKQIGETFSALDKKIELNRAINQNLPIPDRSSKAVGARHAA